MIDLKALFKKNGEMGRNSYQLIGLKMKMKKLV